ncbi:hypothetical protein [Pseudonocardia sp. GCM10023141]
MVDSDTYCIDVLTPRPPRAT